MKNVLDQHLHAQIIADMERVCEVAGVQSKFLKLSMVQFCNEAEVDWVRNFQRYKEDGTPGLVLNGVTAADRRCQAIAAALVRNFIDARVISLNTILELYRGEVLPVPSVLLIPNFYVKGLSRSTPDWKKQILYDVLLNRAVQGKPTVVYIEDLKEFADSFGSAVSDFINTFRLVPQQN